MLVSILMKTKWKTQYNGLLVGFLHTFNNSDLQRLYLYQKWLKFYIAVACHPRPHNSEWQLKEHRQPSNQLGCQATVEVNYKGRI